MTDKRHLLTKPIVTESPGNVKIDWYRHSEQVLSASIEKLAESNRGIFGEFNFSHIFDEFPPVQHLYFNLRSTKARLDIAKRLQDLRLPLDTLSQDFDFEWLSLVDQVCNIAIDSLRKEVPLDNINLPVTEQATIEYLLYPILVRNEPTTIFGAGGSSKSMLADLVAIMVQFNTESKVGWEAKAGNVLYLDWETNADTHKMYVQAIKKGLGITNDTEIYYRRCERDLIDDIEAIHKIVSEKKIDLVIVDSQMAATAMPPPGMDAAQTASAYYNALRTLGCTSLTIDHIPKAEMSEFGNPDTSFGSVVKYNRTRLQFLVKKTQEPEDDYIEISLVNKKFNLGKLHKPMGIRIDFVENGNGNLDQINFKECAIVDNPILARAAPMWERIANELKLGLRTISELAQAFETTQATITTNLNRYKKIFIKVDKDRWGLKEIQ